jgi:hypothetical protein
VHRTAWNFTELSAKCMLLIQALMISSWFPTEKQRSPVVSLDHSARNGNAVWWQLNTVLIETPSFNNCKMVVVLKWDHDGALCRAKENVKFTNPQVPLHGGPKAERIRNLGSRWTSRLGNDVLILLQLSSLDCTQLKTLFTIREGSEFEFRLNQEFQLLHIVQTCSGPIQPPIQCIRGTLLLG